MPPFLKDLNRTTSPLHNLDRHAVERLNSAMACVRLLNGGLSDAEVNAEFASAVPVRNSGLIGDLRLAMKETAGTDSGGLGNHLSRLFGATHDRVAGPIASNFAVAEDCHSPGETLKRKPVHLLRRTGQH